MFAKCSCIVGVLCLALTVVGAACVDFEAVIQNVPEDERMDFLKYHIERGYELSRQDPGSTKDVKTAFSVELYNYMMQHHEVTDEEIKKLLREVICFDDGTCVDIGDVGIHPFM